MQFKHVKTTTRSIMRHSALVVAAGSCWFGTVQAATWYRDADNQWLIDGNWINPATHPDGVGAQVLIDEPQTKLKDGNTTLDVLGNSVKVGRIDVETLNGWEITLTSTVAGGELVFDNGGLNAQWNLETIGNNKQSATVKLGNLNNFSYVLSDNLVITDLGAGQFRPVGKLRDAAGESHSVTYTSNGDFGVGDFKLSWTASNTGGTIVDAGQVRSATTSLDTRIGVAASGPDLLLKNGGRIFVGENISHTLSRSVEIGSGGGKFVSDANDSLTFSGVISGAGDLTVSKTGAGLATVDLTGTTTNTLTGNVVLLSPQTIVGQELLVVADKVGAFGQTPLLTVGTNVIVRITANANSGEGAIDDDATVVRLMSATSVFDVVTGVNEKLGKHKLQRFNGTTYDTIAPGTYSSNTVSWVTGGGTVTVDTGPIGTRILLF